MNEYVCDEMIDNFESESKYIYNETLIIQYIYYVWSVVDPTPNG